MRAPMERKETQVQAEKDTADAERQNELAVRAQRQVLNVATWPSAASRDSSHQDRNLPEGQYPVGKILELMDSVPKSTLPEAIAGRRKDVKLGEMMVNGDARHLVEAFAAMASEAEAFWNRIGRRVQVLRSLMFLCCDAYLHCAARGATATALLQGGPLADLQLAKRTSSFCCGPSPRDTLPKLNSCCVLFEAIRYQSPLMDSETIP